KTAYEIDHTREAELQDPTDREPHAVPPKSEATINVSLATWHCSFVSFVVRRAEQRSAYMLGEIARRGARAGRQVEVDAELRQRRQPRVAPQDLEALGHRGA